MFENKDLLAQSGCYIQLVQANSGLDVNNPIRPFCPTAGFQVQADIDHLECDADFVDVFVVFKADPKLPPSGSNYHTFTSFPDIYFSNIVSAAGAGMSPEEVLHNADDGLQKVFRYRVSLPGAGITTFTFPFSFAPEWYFGDIPWDVHVLTTNSLDPAPLYPNFASEVNPATKIGSLIFEAPYFPIVGSQNLSTIYTDLTGFILDPHSGKTHSILLLPDAGGAPPVFTVDVPWELGLGDPIFGRGKIQMCPGAEIRITVPGTSQANNPNVFFNRVDMYGCDAVSKGITLTDGYLELFNVDIQDAEVGLHVLDGRIRSVISNFENNYLGMRAGDINPSNVPGFSFVIQNEFKNTAPLLPPYPGMTPPSTTKGFGLEVLNYPNLFSDGMSFNNLNNGIFAYRSSIELVGSKFKDISGIPGATHPRHGHAVYAFGSGVEQIKYYNLSNPANADIDNCDKGIYVSQMDAEIRNLHINAHAGIFLDNCRNKLLRIENNILNSRDIGIRSSRCLPTLPGSKISLNKVNMAKPGNTNANGAAILLNEFFKVTQPNLAGWTVTDNYPLTLDHTRWGIRYLGSNQTTIARNQVWLADTDYPHYTGLDLLNSDELSVLCNEVKRPLPIPTLGNYGAATVGFKMNNISQSFYECNTAQATRTGMSFEFMCDNSVLRGTFFDRHNTGLLLREDVTLGTQGLDFLVGQGNPVYVEDHGNRWQPGDNAVHESIFNAVVSLSAFGVDPAEDPLYMPVNNWGVSWFRDEPTPTIPTIVNCSVCTPPPAAHPADRNLEQRIADGSIHTLGLPGVVPVMLENHLYARLMDDTSGITDAALLQFLSAMSGSTAAAFYQVRKGIDALANPDAVEWAPIGALRQDLEGLRASLSTLDSLRAAGTAYDTLLYAALWPQTALLQDSLRTLQAALHAQRVTQAAQMLQQNDAVVATETWEILEKEVNALAIRLYMQDSLSALQLQALDQIGEACLYEGGEAVLRAQVLYNLFVEKDYPRNTDCAGERAAPQAAPEHATVTVSPNPTTGLVRLEGMPAEGCLAELYAPDGRRVLQVRLDTPWLDLGRQTPGVYLLRLAQPDGRQVRQARIVIQRH